MAKILMVNYEDNIRDLGANFRVESELRHSSNLRFELKFLKQERK